MYFGSRMDFLDALPAEIWREILFQVPAPWIYGAHLSDDPLIRSRSYLMNASTIEDAQIERLSLVLVCKALRPLAEELLFTEVNFGSFTTANIFSIIADSNGERRRGYWTKRISILPGKNGEWPDPNEKWDPIFERIKKFCPRLTTVHLRKAESQSSSRMMLPDALMGKLTTLTLESGIIAPNHLLHISAGCPQLKSLRIGLVSMVDGPYYPLLSFPNVQYLTLPSYLPPRILGPLGDLPFPRVEWLFLQHWTCFNERGSRHFILRHASTLIGVEIEAYRPTHKECQPISAVKIKRYICKCPKIQTLVISSPLKGLSPPVTGRKYTRTGFTTVGFNMKHPKEHKVEEYARYFVHERFPSLTTVQLLYHRSVHKNRRQSVSSEDPLASDDFLGSDRGEEEEGETDQEKNIAEMEMLAVWKAHFPHVIVEARYVPFD